MCSLHNLDNNREDRMEKTADIQISKGNYQLLEEIIDYYFYKMDENPEIMANNIIKYAQKVEQHEVKSKIDVPIEGKLGYAYMVLKKYDLADKNLGKALKLPVEDYDMSMYNYYMSLLKKNTGNIKEYETYLLKAYRIEKQNTHVLEEMVDLYKSKGNNTLEKKYAKELRDAQIENEEVY